MTKAEIPDQSWAARIPGPPIRRPGEVQQICRDGERITRVLAIDREVVRIRRELTGTPAGQFLPWSGEPDPDPLPPDSPRRRELEERLEALEREQAELLRRE